MTPVAQSATRSSLPLQSKLSSPTRSASQPQLASSSQRSVPGRRDEFVGATTSTQTGATGAGRNKTATVDSVSNRGARTQMTTGKITINGNTYTYRSGGHGAGNLPNGDYRVTPHLWNRNTPGMVVGGVGYSFALSDKYDSRVGRTRTELRIHPDGGSAGTNGCIGIVGDAATQRRFREDMRAELNRNGGSFNLRVG